MTYVSSFYHAFSGAQKVPRKPSPVTFNLSVTNKVLLPVQHGLLHYPDSAAKPQRCVGARTHSDAKKSAGLISLSRNVTKASPRVCLCPNTDLQCPMTFFKGTLLVFFSPPASLCGVLLLAGGTWSCGVKEGDSFPSLFTTFSRLFKGKQQCSLGSFGLFFISFSVLPSLSTCPRWVIRRHRGHSEAGWKGHYDLCILLLSCLLWSPEGEPLTLLDHTNTKCTNKQTTTGFPAGHVENKPVAH